MIEKKNILIAPLDWGLGHATRCIPVIQQLSKNHHIIVASSGGASQLLKNEFPDLNHEILPSYKVTYPVRRSMSLHMALQIPSVLSVIAQEKKMTKKLIEKHKIQILISDNRFGVYSNTIPSVFITHQVNIKTPYLNRWINKLNHRAIRNFSHCWIPDFENENTLAGELSHPAPENIKSNYIGPLSRFKNDNSEKKYDLTVVLSGPEPQRTLIEDELFKQLFELTDLKINLIRGVYSSEENAEIKNIHVFDHLESFLLEKMLHESKHIICRSGYSSVMDLQNVQAKILFIPTPQQTEQEYLARLHSSKKNYFIQKQGEISITEFLNSPFETEIKNSIPNTDFISLIEEIG